MFNHIYEHMKRYNDLARFQEPSDSLLVTMNMHLAMVHRPLFGHLVNIDRNNHIL